MSRLSEASGILLRLETTVAGWGLDIRTSLQAQRLRLHTLLPL